MRVRCLCRGVAAAAEGRRLAQGFGAPRRAAAPLVALDALRAPANGHHLVIIHIFHSLYSTLLIYRIKYRIFIIFSKMKLTPSTLVEYLIGDSFIKTSTSSRIS